MKMHDDEVEISESLVKRLVATQFPKFADLPLEAVDSAGTNNALYRLGSNLIVRLPRLEKVTEYIDKEYKWLPKLGPHLSVKIPELVAEGIPNNEYPWKWSIYKWIAGTHPEAGQVIGSELVAEDLAKFISELHSIDPTGGPAARRGAPLKVQDPQVRQALKELEGMIDTELAAKVWDRCLEAPAWNKPTVWVHGDLMPMNLFVKNNRLSAVIDFEGMGIGDPACDLIPAWNLLPAEARQVFKDKIGVDDATWERGKGWAFSMALIQLPYYKDTNPVMANNARYVIKQVLETFN